MTFLDHLRAGGPTEREAAKLIEELQNDANRYRYLRDRCSYYYGESYAEPSPREFGIAWQWQDSTPARPTLEEVLDAEVAAWLKRQTDTDD